MHRVSSPLILCGQIRPQGNTGANPELTRNREGSTSPKPDRLIESDKVNPVVVCGLSFS